MNSGYTAHHTRIKTLNRQLISGSLEFGYIFDSSSWQTHKPERRRGTLLGKASFHLDWGVSVANRKQVFKLFFFDRAWGAGRAERQDHAGTFCCLLCLYQQGNCNDLSLIMNEGWLKQLVLEKAYHEEPNFP